MSEGVLPAAFLFRYSLPVPRVDPAADLLDVCHPWPNLEPISNEAPVSFARIVAGWSDRGLGLAVEVTGKHEQPVYDVMEPWQSDGVTLWLDTRATHNVHRATRFCHQFCLIPGAVAEGESPIVQLPVPRAKEDAPTADPAAIEVTVDVRPDGYRIDAWFTPPALHGYDPESSPRLGFYHHVRDAELGNQHTVVGPEFPFSGDPSLWVTLELLD